MSFTHKHVFKSANIGISVQIMWLIYNIVNVGFLFLTVSSTIQLF